VKERRRKEAIRRHIRHEGIIRRPYNATPLGQRPKGSEEAEGTVGGAAHAEANERVNYREERCDALKVRMLVSGVWGQDRQGKSRTNEERGGEGASPWAKGERAPSGVVGKAFRWDGGFPETEKKRRLGEDSPPVRTTGEKSNFTRWRASALSILSWEGDAEQISNTE